MKKIIILFFGFSVYGQKLHHSMISAQGKTAHLPNGMIVRQTIGQQSVIGNYSDNNRTVGQGFQQSSSMKIASQQSKSKSNITTTTYPNPLVNKVNFKFSEPVTGPVKIIFFDLAGRMVYSKEQSVSNNILAVEDISLSEGDYLVTLSAKNYTYSTNVLVTK